MRRENWATTAMQSPAGAQVSAGLWNAFLTAGYRVALSGDWRVWGVDRATVRLEVVDAFRRFELSGLYFTGD